MKIFNASRLDGGPCAARSRRERSELVSCLKTTRAYSLRLQEKFKVRASSECAFPSAWILMYSGMRCGAHGQGARPTRFCVLTRCRTHRRWVETELGKVMRHAWTVQGLLLASFISNMCRNIASTVKQKEHTRIEGNWERRPG